LVSHPSSSGVFYTARQQVFRSDNWGASWTAISSGTSGTIRELAISRSNPVVMLASSGSTVYRSTDAGTTFTNVTSGTPSRTITSIYVHPDSSNVFYITFSGFGAGKIFKSSNSGTSWSDVSGNLPDSPTNDVQVYYPGIATSVLLAAMDVGVFMTTNYGVSWTEMAEGLPNTVAIHLDYHTATNKLRVGTHGRGVWETTIPTGVINYTNGFPSQYYLLQNYPNPFNPLTTIKYALKENSTVRLSVYDILGREIKQLVNETQKAGTYTIQFNAEGLSSGIYLYKIQTENYSETKRMILTK
jgi:photosystem II stability/assembly factor-like uncharacterized protein